MERIHAGGTVLAEYTEFTSAVPTWTKSYTYLGSSQLATVSPNGTGGEYVEFNHQDRLGTRVVTSQAGGTSYEQVTLPFGTALNAESTLTTNNKRFTSYDRSAPTGLDYAINRTYDSKQGRFTQVDPIGMSAASLAAPQTLNMYAYCGNDPVNYTDPSGLFWGKILKWIGKALKWLAIAVVVAVVVMSGPFAPASGSILANLLGILIKIGAKIGLATNFLAGGALLSAEAAAIGVIAARLGALTLAIAGSAVGAIANRFQQTKSRGNRNGFPCPPTFRRIFDQFKNLFLRLLENESGHLTNDPLENGGWIYQRKNGDLFFLRADNSVKMGGQPAQRYRGSINLNSPPNIRGARVVARAHTHPYDPYEQGLILKGQHGGPSTGDFNQSIRYQMPIIAIHQVGVSADGKMEIAIENANPNISVMPDPNCRR